MREVYWIAAICVTIIGLEVTGALDALISLLSRDKERRK